MFLLEGNAFSFRSIFSSGVYGTSIILRLIILLFLLINPISSFAENAVLATDPDCAKVDKIDRVAIEMINSGLASIMSGSQYASYTGSASLGATAPKLGIGIAAMFISNGMLNLYSGAFYSPEYMICHSAYVRHPVAVDGKGSGNGIYQQCGTYETPFPAACNKSFRTLDDYLDCINKETGSREEPKCLSSSSAPAYVWPKNRAFASDYINVCERMPVPFSGKKLGVNNLDVFGKAWGVAEAMPGTPVDGLNQDVLDALDPREIDIGMEFGNLKPLLKLKGFLAKGLQREPNCKVMYNGETSEINNITFETYLSSGRICARAIKYRGVPLRYKVLIGCHKSLTSDMPQPLCPAANPIYSQDNKGTIVAYDNTPCYKCVVSESCYNDVAMHSKNVVPITSYVAECLKETLYKTLVGCTNAIGGKTGGILDNVRVKMKDGVTLLLTLSLLLFSVKAWYGGESLKQIYVTVLKYAFVIALVNGSVLSEYYTWLTALSNGIADIVVSVAGNNTVCDFKPDDYLVTSSTGVTKSYNYLSLWDRLDCRIIFYLGGTFGGAGGAAILLTFLLGAFTLPVTLILFPAQALIVFAALQMSIMLVLVIGWILYLFSISIVLISLLTFLGTLFIPMFLFDSTKQYFENWLKEIITYSVYPIILFGFLSFMFSVLDELFFGELKYKRNFVDLGAGSKITYILDDKIPGNNCKTSPASATLACLAQNFGIGTKDVFFGFSLSHVESDGLAATEDMWQRIAAFGLMLFIFYHFLGTLGHLAAELAGNFRSDISSGVKGVSQVMGGINTKLLNASGKAGKMAADKIKESAGEGAEKSSRGDVGKGGSSGGSGGGDVNVG